MDFTTVQLKNTALTGHVGTGKTTLLEQILFSGGAISKAETVESGKTVSDYSEEEIEKKISFHSTLAYIVKDDKKLNFIDTPGASDFIGEVTLGLRACETDLMVIGADTGAQIETMKIWRRLDARNIPRMVFINKMDKDRACFKDALADMKKKFGMTFVPVVIPMGEAKDYKGVISLLTDKAYMIPAAGAKEAACDIPADMADLAAGFKELMIEGAAEGDDEIMEKYLNDGTLSMEDVKKALINGLHDNKIVPVLAGSAVKCSGIAALIDFISEISPSPLGFNDVLLDEEKNRTLVPITPDGDVRCFTFKTNIDQFSGKLSFWKCICGVITQDMELMNSREGKKEKVGKLYTCVGKKLVEVKELVAGDIGIAAKMPLTLTNDTLYTGELKDTFIHLRLPTPTFEITVSADDKKNEDKLAQFMQKAAIEDTTFRISYNKETTETIVSGMGELQVNMILDKIRDKQKISISTKLPQVAYRETITKKAAGSYRHKKQSGGHGQFAEVHFEVQPIERGEYLRFINTIKGGAVSKGYIPGIEKGIAEGMQEGYLAGYPIVDIEVNLFDGKEHPVDSSEMAFKMASKGCLKEVISKASPVLLEPVMKLAVFVEDQYLGDVLSDLSSKRGKVLGQDSMGGGLQQVNAEVPQAELLRYAVDLRSITSGTGSFEVEFDHYSPINGKIADAVIADAKARMEAAQV
ncbi:MAG: elongation factor G [Spirochaetia bacterium]|nr:elongation factor G [Spirochaetia bacterium]